LLYSAFFSPLFTDLLNYCTMSNRNINDDVFERKEKMQKEALLEILHGTIYFVKHIIT
jgi:hypothetical protein